MKNGANSDFLQKMPRYFVMLIYVNFSEVMLAHITQKGQSKQSKLEQKLWELVFPSICTLDPYRSNI